MTNSSDEEAINSWITDIRARFPDWNTAAALQRWSSVSDQLQIGQEVTREVIARAPFGVWGDIGVPFAGLLLVPNMKEATVRRIAFEDYPATSTMVDARINSLGSAGEIGLTQKALDPMIEAHASTMHQSLKKRNRPNGD